MIPWSSFTGANPLYTDQQFPLRESILLSHFSATAPRVSEYEECPMLNNACERRFALSQLNQSPPDLDAEHVDNIKSTIDHLMSYYHDHYPSSPLSCPPASPALHDLARLTDMAGSVTETPPCGLNDIPRSGSSTLDGNETGPFRPYSIRDALPKSATPSSDPTSPAPPSTPRHRLSISCLIHAEPDQPAKALPKASPKSHYYNRVIVPEGSTSSPSDISDQFTSIPPLRLTLDNKQCSMADEPLLRMADDVNLILLQMLPHAATLSHQSLTDRSPSPHSLKPPRLPPETASQEGHSRIQRAVRKRRHSLSPDLSAHSPPRKTLTRKKVCRDMSRHASDEEDG